jgi:hypothetical protein
VPSAADAGTVTKYLLDAASGDLEVTVGPIPHMPPGMALDINQVPYGALASINSLLDLNR